MLSVNNMSSWLSPSLWPSSSI